MFIKKRIHLKMRRYFQGLLAISFFATVAVSAPAVGFAAVGNNHNSKNTSDGNTSCSYVDMLLDENCGKTFTSYSMSSGTSPGWRWASKDSVFRDLLDSGEFTGKGFAYVAQRLLEADVDGTLSQDEVDFLNKAAEGDLDSRVDMAWILNCIGDKKFVQEVATKEEKDVIERHKYNVSDDGFSMTFNYGGVMEEFYKVIGDTSTIYCEHDKNNPQ